jgi:hypothetical protein
LFLSPGRVAVKVQGQASAWRIDVRPAAGSDLAEVVAEEKYSAKASLMIDFTARRLGRVVN